MSILKKPFASPSRIRGIYQFLLTRRNCEEERIIVEKTLSPEALSDNSMIKESIDVSVEMGLLTLNNAILSINVNLPKKAGKKLIGVDDLPFAISSLIFDIDNENNHDFVKSVAWYLCQDVFTAPGNWEEFSILQQNQLKDDGILVSNDTRYGQFEDWICYLGLCQLYSKQHRVQILPDSTKFMKTAITEIFAENKTNRLSFTKLLSMLNMRFPIFEGSFFRNNVESVIGEREINHLSSSTSLALLRLVDDGCIRLDDESDADETYIIQFGGDSYRYSTVIYLAKFGGEK